MPTLRCVCDCLIKRVPHFHLQLVLQYLHFPFKTLFFFYIHIRPFLGFMNWIERIRKKTKEKKRERKCDIC
jgi:hypothetical protein